MQPAGPHSEPSGAHALTVISESAFPYGRCAKRDRTPELHYLVPWLLNYNQASVTPSRQVSYYFRLLPLVRDTPYGTVYVFGKFSIRALLQSIFKRAGWY